MGDRRSLKTGDRLPPAVPPRNDIQAEGLTGRAAYPASSTEGVRVNTGQLAPSRSSEYWRGFQDGANAGYRQGWSDASGQPGEDR